MTSVVISTPRLRRSECRDYALAPLMKREGLTYRLLVHAPTCAQPWTDRADCPECQAIEASMEFARGRYAVSVRWAGEDGDWFSAPAEAADHRAAVVLSIETARALGLRPWMPAPTRREATVEKPLDREEFIERVRGFALGPRPTFGGGR